MSEPHVSQEVRPIIRIVICGFGEIASKAHFPAIQRVPHQFRLVAIVDPNTESVQQRLSKSSHPNASDILVYKTLLDCINDMKQSIDAISVCTPSSVTLNLAQTALECNSYGRNNIHVLVEKPPGNWRRLQRLKHLAMCSKSAFFTAYHTAACVGHKHIVQWLNAHIHELQSVHVTWKESVRKWHPKQYWITKKQMSKTDNDASADSDKTKEDEYCAAEGVLDMVFNPLSLLHALLGQLTYRSSTLIVPSNWETPIEGTFELAISCHGAHDENKTDGIPVTGDFAWNYEPSDSSNDDGEDDSEEIWNIYFQSAKSALHLKDGGSQVYVDGHRVTTQPTSAYPLQPEYENLYDRFYNLVCQRKCHVDDATPKLLEEIQINSARSVGPPYNL